MRYKTFKIGIIALSIILFGCVKADYTSTTDHPLKSKITIKFDFSGGGIGIDIPEEDIVILQDGKEITPNADGTLPLVDPGDYRFVIYNEASPIVVSSQEPTPPAIKGDVIASMPMNDDGFIEQMPEWFFSGFTDMSVEHDKDYTKSFVMQQQIHELNFDLTITEGDPGRINAIDAELSGVASGWNLVTNTPSGAPAKVKVPFTLTSDKLNATIRLFGTASTEVKSLVEQFLTLNMTFADGRKQQIVSNISSQLKGFNSNKSTPMTLQGDVHTPIETGQDGSITDWIVIQENMNVN